MPNCLTKNPSLEDFGVIVNDQRPGMPLLGLAPRLPLLVGMIISTWHRRSPFGVGSMVLGSPPGLLVTHLLAWRLSMERVLPMRGSPLGGLIAGASGNDKDGRGPWLLLLAIDHYYSCNFCTAVTSIWTCYVRAASRSRWDVNDRGGRGRGSTS